MIAVSLLRTGHRFDELRTDYRSPAGFDRARNVEIGVRLTLLQCSACFSSFPSMLTCCMMCWVIILIICVVMQHKGFELQVLDEAFTSEHWIVRIYKVKKPSNTIATPDAPSQHPSRHKRFGQAVDGE